MTLCSARRIDDSETIVSAAQWIQALYKMFLIVSRRLCPVINDLWAR